MRKFCIAFIAVFTLFTSISLGQTYEGNSGTDCIRCHTLNAEQARAILGTAVPGLKVLHVKPAPLNGLWEVGIDSGGRKGILYFDFSLRKIFTGNIIDLQNQRNYTQESFNEINKVDRSQIPLDDALVLGDKNAKHKVIVFDDPD